MIIILNSGESLNIVIIPKPGKEPLLVYGKIFERMLLNKLYNSSTFVIPAHQSGIREANSMIN